MCGAVGLALCATTSMAKADDWFKDVKFSGYVEAGGIGNSSSPDSGLTWGQLFTDRNTEIMMNQLSLIAEPGHQLKEAI